MNFFKKLKGMDRNVWIRVIGETITSSAMMMLMPFFALYLEGKVDSMLKVGFIMSISPIASLFGSMIGGRLADLYGRKRMMVFSTLGTSIILVLFSLVEGYTAFLILSILLGISNSFFNPAASAMVADVTEPDERTEAYGLLRVGSNLGTVIGPLLGSSIVFFSKDSLFYIAATALGLYSIAQFILLKETLPAGKDTNSNKEDTKIPFKKVMNIILSDKLLLFYVATGVIISMGFSQIEGMLPLYFKQRFSSHFGEWNPYPFLMSINGLLVVLFQFPISSYLSNRSIGKTMFYGTVLFGLGILSIGFAPPILLSIGFGKWLILLFLAIIFIYYTFGEMVMSPVQMTFVANIAPEELRATYMAVGSMKWTIGGFLGPLLGGFLFDLKLGLWLFIILGTGVVISGLMYRSLDEKVAIRDNEHGIAQ
ncbi:MDR family MFS transporter [Gottfriedia luciferensis]|uniref:MDR family MFS transporter n=1 Tax=Gottfriedia luciferensis TaxID=178774 RepID=UPI000B44AB62|nr:MFS transporter [Gottfriedia luciferensis]